LYSNSSLKDSNLHDRERISLLGDPNEHELLRKIFLVWLLQVVTELFKSLDAGCGDVDRALNNKLTRIDLRLSLLDLQHALSDLRSIWDFHQLHADDLDAGLLDPLLHKVAHGRANHRSGAEQRRRVLGTHREQRAHGLDNLLGIVV
jgi:hypothetical protein